MIISTTSASASAAASADSFSIDPKQVDALRQSARQNSPDALKAVAKQFEGLFMNMMMKSMRDATPKDGLLDNEQGKMFTSMMDQQLSQNFAKRGVGLADVLIRQLSGGRSPGAAEAAADVPGGVGAAALPAPGNGALDPALSGKPRAGGLAQAAAVESGFQANLQAALDSGIPGVLKAVLTGARNNAFGAAALDATGSAVSAAGRSVGKSVAKAVDGAAGNLTAALERRSQPAHVRAFEDKLAAHADEAARATGVPAKFMLGQAALESGWGKREILAADGSSSHNVFGVKAGAGWKGRVVETATTEYVNGVPERQIARFKAYDSYADAFKDYAKTLTNNPRYSTVLANAQNVQGFAQGLQRAGYATDPHYAAKLTRIITHSLSA